MPKVTTRTLIIGDSMDEMLSYYSMADLALIGGSFQDFGGQNLIEACAYYCPVICGPNMFNFTKVTKLAVQHQVAIQTENMTQALSKAIDLLEQPKQLYKLQIRAIHFVKQYQGSSKASVLALQPWLNKTNKN